MKYEFDLNFKQDHYELLISLTHNNSFGKVQKTINIDANSPAFENVLSEIIDNMRLTVNEREDVRNNAAVFTDYLKYYKSSNNVSQEVQINEDDLTAEIDSNKVDDNAVINSVLNEDEDEDEPKLENNEN